MGLQDRDYYRDKYKEVLPSSNPVSRSAKRNSTGIKYILYSLITIVAFGYGTDTFLDKINGITLIPLSAADRKQKPPERVSEGIVSQNGHSGVARSIGNTLGGFSASVGAGLTNTIAAQQPQWITINPKSKEECFAESGKVLNAVYMRCRNGRQEFVRFDASGKKIVLNERPIPMH